jgi:hypothetical protein
MTTLREQVVEICILNRADPVHAADRIIALVLEEAAKVAEQTAVRKPIAGTHEARPARPSLTRDAIAAAIRALTPPQEDAT